MLEYCETLARNEPQFFRATKYSETHALGWSFYELARSSLTLRANAIVTGKKVETELMQRWSVSRKTCRSIIRAIRTEPVFLGNFRKYKEQSVNRVETVVDEVICDDSRGTAVVLVKKISSVFWTAIAKDCDHLPPRLVPEIAGRILDQYALLMKLVSRFDGPYSDEYRRQMIGALSAVAARLTPIRANKYCGTLSHQAPALIEKIIRLADLSMELTGATPSRHYDIENEVERILSAL